MASFEYKKWSVQRSAKQPLLDFLVDGLKAGGCTVLSVSDPSHAPFLISYETPMGERQGVLAYAFLANSQITRNRPEDEHRFQIKYGSDPHATLPLERDSAQLLTTIFVGIDPVRKMMVGADPVLHDGTKMFISLEFKRSHVKKVLEVGWHAWERESSKSKSEPVEVLVGVQQKHVLEFITFERHALGLDAGHRQLIAEQLLGNPRLNAAVTAPHALTAELKMPADEVLNLIQRASRLKMAVRGWVAEHHLEQYLQTIPGVKDCRRLDQEGRPDIELRFKRSGPLLIECKNVLRVTAKGGIPRVDFQRTRASKADPCSRYYKPGDFHVLAACLHAVTENWEYRFIPTIQLPAHLKCTGRIQSNLRVDAGWYRNPADAFIALA
ncbi:hypothetical protein H010_15799 [Hydrogenophaga taeniospiralis CCUG 15921]|uniref:Methylase-associated X1 domain-containing protein n=2 Tax=Hydrogenophaga TaxID=47420 RepID=A0A9X4NSU4_9BURK|nr:hypothetical protein [Hydrogenophaga taeniospiralis]MDG5976732.1 hypothetical protein [Hydrogenophaga taeniospiralis CCUG 15921]